MAELIPGGSKIRVTNDTKLRYLDALAQHRLASSIRNEIDHFLRGLNELIPDNLLGIFDENELEVQKISLSARDNLSFEDDSPPSFFTVAVMWNR